jgi:hypothetical protein
MKTNKRKRLLGSGYARGEYSVSFLLIRYADFFVRECQLITSAN